MSTESKRTMQCSRDEDLGNGRACYHWLVCVKMGQETRREYSQAKQNCQHFFPQEMVIS